MGKFRKVRELRQQLHLLISHKNFLDEQKLAKNSKRDRSHFEINIKH